MKTFDDFWPFYLREHARATTRRLHFIGTSLAVMIALYAIATRQPRFVLAALLCGYAFAWVGHVFIEHNRPATFQHPLWSFRGDFRMLAFALTGRLPAELTRLGIPR